MLYFASLYFTLLHFTSLHFTLLYFTLLYFTLLYFTLLYFTLLYFTYLLTYLLYLLTYLLTYARTHARTHARNNSEARRCSYFELGVPVSYLTSASFCYDLDRLPFPVTNIKNLVKKQLLLLGRDTQRQFSVKYLFGKAKIA